MKTYLLLLIILVTCGVPTIGFPQEGKSASFAEVVRANFSQWDGNSDGVLSKDEIEAAAANLKVRDEAAAAVAAIEHGIRGKKFTPPPITEEYLVSSPSQESAASDKPDDSADEDSALGNNQRPAFQKIYLKALRKIQQTSRELFPQSLPLFDAVHQGQLGDCPFVSTVGAMVYRNPAAVKAMFSPSADGSTTVNFGDGRHLNIHNLTDVDIALWSSAGTNGLWLTILEKAYRRMLVATEHPDPKDRPSIYDKFGPSTLTLEILDGHQTRKVQMRTVRSGKTGLETLRKDLVAAQNEKLLVKAGTPAAKKTPGITPDHAYAILGYDKETDLVHIWNPHGNDFTPKGPEGLQNGYTMKRGEFDVPLKDLDQIFYELNFEIPANYRH